MTTRDLVYNEAKSPLMTTEENINFRQFQLFIYRTVYNLIQQGFSRANLIAKLKAFAGQIMIRSNNYYICDVVESADYIRITFWAAKHPMSRALYEITYDEL